MMAVWMTNVTVMWTALSAAATTTRIESQQHGWLHKVSKCARMQERNEMTYQCRPGNPQIFEHPSMESLGRAVDAKQSHSNLEISVKRAKSKLPTLDAQSRCGRCGGLETKSDGRGMLLPSARVRGSADEEELKTMDEEQRLDQQDQVTCAPRLLPNRAITQKSQTFASTSLKIGHIYSDTTQSF